MRYEAPKIPILVIANSAKLARHTSSAWKFRSPSRRSVSLFVLTALALVPSVSSAREEKAVAQPPVESQPSVPDGQAFDGQEEWKAFLKLAAKPNGLVTLRDVEHALRRKLVPDPRTGSYRIQGLVRLSFNKSPRLQQEYPGRKASWVILTLRRAKGAPCLSRSQIVSDLQNAGWTLAAHSEPRIIYGPEGYQIRAPAGDGFQKGDQGSIGIQYPDNCPDDISLQSNKLEYFLNTEHYKELIK